MEHLGTGIPVVRGEHILEDGTLSTQWSNYWFIAPDVDAQYPRTKLLEGDLLCSVRGTIGKIGLVESNHVGANISLNLIRISLYKDLVNCRYLWYFLRSLLGQQAIKAITSSTTISTIQASSLKQVSIPLPPMSEQRRIVEILEQADTLRKKRAEADAKAERILPALFIKMFGDPATNPMEWEEFNLEELIVDGPQNGLYKHASAYGEGTPIIRIDSFYNGSIDESKELRRLRLTADEANYYQLHENDIVINRVNGSLDFLGKSALIPKLSETTVFESNMMRFSVNTARVDPLYLIRHLQTPATRQQIVSKCRHINQASINQGDVKLLNILLPPISLQRKFTDQVKTIQTILKSQANTQSVLHKLFQKLLSLAFSGELTVKWRKAHMQELLAEMEQQAKNIGVSTDVEYEQLSLL
jgi:type I restriction enzyme S subunit